MSRLAEPLKTAILTILQANLPAQLTAIALEYQADQIPLLPPDPGHYFYGLRATPPDSGPAIYVEVERTRAQPNQQGNLWGVNTHTVLIDVWCISDNEDTLHHQLDRYARAVYAVMFANQTLVVNNQSFAISLLPSDGMITPAFKNPSGTNKIWRWVMTAEKEEDSPF